MRASPLAPLAIALLAAGWAGAQEYRLDWHTLDSGGGISAGGPYQLAGTIGQPDATLSALSGATYTLTGGFWAGWVPPSQEEPPALQIESAADGLIISWTDAAGFTLEETADLASGEWTLSPAANGVPVPAAGHAVFYRLRQL